MNGQALPRGASATRLRPAWIESLYLAPTALLLLVLPIAHTTAPRRIFLLFSVAAAAWIWRQSKPPRIPLLPAFAVCAAAAFASLITATDPASSLGEIKREIGYGLATFLTYFVLSRSAREISVWMSALLTALVLLGAYTLWAYPTVGTLHFDGWHGGVLNYSVFIATIYPLLLCAIVFPGLGNRWKHLAWMLVPLGLCTAYLTGNRIFWVAIVASSLVFAGMYARRASQRSVKAALVAGVLAIVAVSAVGFLGTAAQRLGSNAGPASTLSTTMETDPRVMLWSYGVQHIRQHPWTGTGFGRMQQAQRFRESLNNQNEFVHAHNMFLDYGVQMGIPGIAAYLFLFFCVVREFVRLYRSPDPRAVLIGITGVAIVVAVIVKSMTDDQFIHHNALLFWALVGMGLGYGTRLAQGVRPKPQTNPA